MEEQASLQFHIFSSNESESLKKNKKYQEGWGQNAALNFPS